MLFFFCRFVQCLCLFFYTQPNLESEFNEMAAWLDRTVSIILVQVLNQFYKLMLASQIRSKS